MGIREHFIKEFTEIYDRESKKLPYHINVIDELRAGENAHSRILNKLLNQKTADNEFEILESFIQYLKGKNCHFGRIEIKNPKITQEKERIDLWIQDRDYAIIIENKINWASDQTIQLSRYIDITKAQYKEEQIYILYLAPVYDKTPSEQTWGDYKEKFKDRYQQLSFKEDILDWLENKLLPNLRVKDVQLLYAVGQYIDHLKGMFNLRKNKMTMELQKLLRKEFEKKPDALHELIEQAKQVEEELVKDKINEIGNLLKEDFKDCEISPINDNGYSFGFKVGNDCRIYVFYNPTYKVWGCGTTYPDGKWQEKEFRRSSYETAYADFKEYFSAKKAEIK
jgi:hypothetical protein